MDHPCFEFYQEIPARRGVFAAGGWAAWWSKKWSVIVTLLLDYRDNNAICYYDKPWSKDTLDDDDSDIALVTSEQSKHIVIMISRWSSDLLLFQDSWERGISGYSNEYVSKVSRKSDWLVIAVAVADWTCFDFFHSEDRPGGVEVHVAVGWCLSWLSCSSRKWWVFYVPNSAKFGEHMP